MPRLARLIVLTVLLMCATCSVALADGPVGTDPHANYPVSRLPDACRQPTSAACLDASVGFLDQARASLGQPGYQLPINFDSLSPQVQMFVLTNSDRVLAGLPPVTGLTAALSQDAMGGVIRDNDPLPTDTNFNAWTSNWAGGFGNVVLAYEAWMYDDGPGSGNLDCTAQNNSGCWGHRHDILWSFDGAGALAMGAAVGTDPNASPGYAMLLGLGDAGTYRPLYTYTWAQAVAAGATPGGAPTTGTGSATTAASGHSAAGAGPPGSPSARTAKPPAGPRPARAKVTVNGHGRRHVRSHPARPHHSAAHAARSRRR